MLTRDAKYIIFDDGLNDIPMIFPNHVQHNSMAFVLAPWTPISAGFVRINEQGAVEAYGQSIGLQLKSRPETDNKLLAKLFNK